MSTNATLSSDMPGGPVSAARRPVNPWLIAPMVAIAAFMEVLDISIANVSLQHIAGSLGASASESTWVLTSYLVTNAIALPVAGWFANYFGRTRFFMACIIGFTVASLACGLSTSLEMLILFRALQGLAGGALQPISQAILADAFPVAKRPMAFAVYGIAVVAAPAIGPTLGGWITDEFSWHWIFLINVPVGIVLIALIRRYIPDEAPQREGIKIDYLGFGLIALGLGALQWVMDRGHLEDWFDSSLIITLTVLCVISISIYLARALDQDQPIVDVRLFRFGNYALANIMMFVLGLVLFGSTALMPLFMQTLMGYSAFDAGLVLSPGGIAIMIMMPVVGKLTSHVDLRILITFGLIVSGTALWHLGSYNLSVSNDQLMLSRVWQTLGIAFLFIPITTAAYAGLPMSANNQASSMLAFMRNLGGGVGIAMLVTLLERMSSQNRWEMVAHTAPTNPIWTQHMATLSSLVGEGEQALALAQQQIAQQAQLLAFMDGFRLLGVLFLLLIPLVWLLKPGHGEPIDGASAH